MPAHEHPRKIGPAFRTTTRLMALLGAIALVLGVAGPAGAITGPKLWLVWPGQSIQTAADKARSGDTIWIAPGTYQEAVCIVGKGLTIIGSGRELTRISYPSWSAIADLPAVDPGNPCWAAHAAADTETDLTTLADDVSGLFFLHPDAPVTVTGIATQNHPADGITVWGGTGVTIHDTKGTGHERYGIAVAASTDIAITGNIVKGITRPAPVFAGTGGITVSDTPHADALVVGNRVQGQNIGLFLRESRTGHAVDNLLTGNCIGILVFDDSAREIPDTAGAYAAGDWTLKTNTSKANTRYCIAGRDGSQRTSGVGIAVVNADDVTITGNSVLDNVPTVPAGEIPVNFPSGGIVLLGFAPPPGTSPPGAVNPGTVENVTARLNVVKRNLPADLVTVQPTPFNPLILAPGPGIVLQLNACGVSSPAGAC